MILRPPKTGVKSLIFQRFLPPKWCAPPPDHSPFQLPPASGRGYWLREAPKGDGTGTGWSLWCPITGRMAVGWLPGGWVPSEVAPAAARFFAEVRPVALATTPQWSPRWVVTTVYPGTRLHTLRTRFALWLGADEAVG